VWRRNARPDCPEDHDRIDARRAVRRDVAGRDRDRDQTRGHDGEGERIGRAHAEEQTRHRSGNEQRHAQADGYARHRKDEPSRRTIVRTRRASAPSAIRIPSSIVRWLTAYEMTP